MLILYSLSVLIISIIWQEMMDRFCIFAIAAWSGFFVMAIELLSGRLLAPNFGNSIYVWGAVITVFMLALSIGYLLGGRFSLWSPSLKRLCLILIIAALSLTPAVLISGAILDRLFVLIEDPRYGSLFSATILFFVPTMISGMVSPYAVRLLVTESRKSGHSAGLLYFVSTFGSAAGTILTSFYLVLYFEINTIFWIMICISLALGLFSFFVGRKYADDH